MTTQEEIARIIVQDVAEIADRTSPDAHPEIMCVTADELRDIVLSALSPLGEPTVTIPQRAFATESDDYLRGFGDGSAAAIEAATKLRAPPEPTEGRSFAHLARQLDLMAKGCRLLGLDSQEDDWDSRRQDANKGVVEPEVIVEAIDYDYRNGHDGRAAAHLLVEALCKDLAALRTLPLQDGSK